MPFLQPFTITFLFVSLSAIVHSKDAPYWIYGLFSMSSCESRFPFSCAKVDTNQQLLEITIRLNNNILDSKMGLCSQDVGNNETQLLNSLLPGLYQAKFNLTGKCINPLISGIRESKALFVYTHLTFELTQLVSAVLLPFEIPLLAITYQTMYPASFLTNPLYVYSYEASFGRDIHKTAINNFRKQLNITIAAMLSLVEDSQTNANKATNCQPTDDGAFCTYVDLQIPGGCFKERIVEVRNPKDLNKTLETILKTPSLSFVLVQGTSTLLTYFNNRINKLTKTNSRLKNIFFLNFERESDHLMSDRHGGNATTQQGIDLTLARYGDHNWTFNNVYQLPGFTGFNTLLHFVHHLPKHFLTADLLRDLGKFYSLDQMKEMLIRKNPAKFSFLKTFVLNPKFFEFFINEELKMSMFEEIKYTRELLFAYLYVWKDVFYLERLLDKASNRSSVLNSDTALEEQPFCYLTKPECEKGKELVYSYYVEPNWHRSYGHHCQQCKTGYFKNISGNIKCTQCPYSFFSSEDGTSCYDPYTSIYLSLRDSKAFLIYIVLSTIQALLVVYTLYTFYKNQHSPLVKASHRDISYVQLTTHILLTVIPPILFEGVPNIGKCLARPITIGILLSIITSINLAKTQKVLRIFSSKVRMTRKDVLMTKATEIFVIVFILVLDICILVVTLVWGGAVEKHVAYDNVGLRAEYYCSNDTVLLVQYVFILCVIITSAIQGIRAHKLPSQYRETNYVVYASFMSGITIMAAVGIHYSQRSEHAKTVVLMFTGLLLNHLNFLLIYLYKVYVLLVGGDINSSDVFRRQRQMKIASILVEAHR